MKIEQLTVEHFTAFDAVTTFDFCPGINVLIGGNATGKTHVMKLLYTLLKVHEQAQLDSEMPGEGVQELLRQKLFSIFKPDAVGRLVRRQRGQNNARVQLQSAGAIFDFALSTQGNISLTSYRDSAVADPVVYLPVREFLSIYPGFIAAYQKRETAFDETYYDLAVALDARPLRGPKSELFEQFVLPLRKVLGGTVTQENRKFYLELPEGKIEAHLAAEGYRKLAELLYLINNGSVAPDGVLLWDEPASNLNPNLVPVVVAVLKTLAQNGVQVFVATHDFLLSQEFSLLAEYHPTELALRFFALHKPNKRSGALVEMGKTLVEIKHNPILEEFAAHYDREISLFVQTAPEA